MTRRRRFGLGGLGDPYEPRVTKTRDQLRAEAIDCAAEDMTAIFEVLGKATSIQHPFQNAQEIAERLPIANLVTQAAGASGIVTTAAHLYEKNYARLEHEATEFPDDGLSPLTSSEAISWVPAVSDLEAEEIIRGGGVGPLIRRRHRDPDPEPDVDIAPSPGDVLCLRCGQPVSRHRPRTHPEDSGCPSA